MTWPKASPILVAAAVCDAIRAFFEFFWFFGPALAAIYCTVKINGVLTTITVGLLETKTAGVICSATAIAAGTAVSEFTTTFGVIMADVVGLAAFLILGFFLVRTNARMFKINKSSWLWLTGSLGISVIPFIGTFPSFFFVLRMLYKRQIKIEKAAHERWKKETANAQLQERNQNAAQLMQLQTAQVAQANQEATNDAVYAEAANDTQYTQEMNKAA